MSGEKGSILQFFRPAPRDVVGDNTPILYTKPQPEPIVASRKQHGRRANKPSASPKTSSEVDDEPNSDHESEVRMPRTRGRRIDKVATDSDDESSHGSDEVFERKRKRRKPAHIISDSESEEGGDKSVPLTPASKDENQPEFAADKLKEKSSIVIPTDLSDFLDRFVGRLYEATVNRGHAQRVVRSDSPIPGQMYMNRSPASDEEESESESDEEDGSDEDEDSGVSDESGSAGSDDEHISYDDIPDEEPSVFEATFDAPQFLDLISVTEEHHTRYMEQFKQYQLTKDMSHLSFFLELVAKALRVLALGKERKNAGIPYDEARYRHIKEDYRKGRRLEFFPFSEDALRDSLYDFAIKRNKRLDGKDRETAIELAKKQLCYLCQTYVTYPVANVWHNDGYGQACTTCYRKFTLVNCVRHAIRICANEPMRMRERIVGALVKLVSDAHACFVCIDQSFKVNNGLLSKKEMEDSIKCSLDLFSAVWAFKPCKEIV